MGAYACPGVRTEFLRTACSAASGDWRAQSQSPVSQSPVSRHIRPHLAWPDGFADGAGVNWLDDCRPNCAERQVLRPPGPATRLRSRDGHPAVDKNPLSRPLAHPYLQARQQRRLVLAIDPTPGQQAALKRAALCTARPSWACWTSAISAGGHSCAGALRTAFGVQADLR